MKIPQWTPVIVRWIDAHTDYDERSAADYARGWKKAVRRSIGFLIFHDRERVVIAMEDDRQCRDLTDTQTVTTIPRGLLIEPIIPLRQIPKRRGR